MLPRAQDDKHSSAGRQQVHTKFKVIDNNNICDHLLAGVYNGLLLIVVYWNEGWIKEYGGENSLYQF